MLHLIKNILSLVSPKKLLTQAFFVQEDKLFFNGQFLPLMPNAIIKLLCIGKSAVNDYETLINYLPKNYIDDSLVVTKITDKKSHNNSNNIVFSSHPYPDAYSILCSSKVITFLKQLKQDDLLIVILSGGTSSLIVSPNKFISFEDKILIHKELVLSGAPIESINLIRQSMSEIKNGGLLEHCNKCNILFSASSDVASNKLNIIGSGLFHYQPLDKKILKNIASKYLEKNKYSYIKFLDKVHLKKSPSTKPKNEFIWCDSQKLLTLAKKYLENHFKVKVFIIEKIYSDSFDTGVEEHLNHFEKLVKEHNEFILISGGELNVNVQGNGQGGRNTHFVLEMSNLLFNKSSIEFKKELLTILSIGTDGDDGPTDSAGSWFNWYKLQEANLIGLNFEQYLNQFDSYSFFEKLSCLLKTGPTGINLMDLRLIIYKNI
jgi:glycerate 2-kinase